MSSDEIPPKSIRNIQKALQSNSVIRDAARLQKSIELSSSEHQGVASFVADMQRLSGSLNQMHINSIIDVAIPKGLASTSEAFLAMKKFKLPKGVAAKALEFQSSFERFKHLGSGVASQLLRQQEQISDFLRDMDESRLSALRELSLFKGLDNLPPVASMAMEFSVQAEEMYSSAVTINPKSALNEGVVDEIQSSDDFNNLSYQTKRVFYSLICLIVVILQSVITSYTTPYLKEKIDEVVNPSDSQVRHIVLGVDNNILKHIRYISGSRVNVRQSPSMKSETLNILERGKLVTVVDKSNRKWVEVEYEIDGEKYTGWVSRKYALILHK